MSAVKPTFEVDKKGMAEVFARKGKAFVVTELIQNAWDEAATTVHVTLESLGQGKAKIVVEDDNPEGFADLAHAYTLFAPSLKKGDVEKRGRFNLGEKLVIAICDTASIETTKGTIVFDAKGRRHLPKKRKAGSVFTGVLRMTKDDVAEVEKVIHTLLPPHGVETTFNMNEIGHREPVAVFQATLRTEVANDEGQLKATTRKTNVEVYEPLAGETPTVYELGIPVVEVEGDRFHVNVGQKVPLPLDRDNLPPSYLRHLRVEVLNHTHEILSDEDKKASWVSNAMEDERIEPDAAKSAFEGKFGKKTVIFDPNDLEGNKRAAAEGYTVVPGGALPSGAWKNVKANEIALPAGQVTPTPSADGKDDLPAMDPAHYPSYVANVVEWAKEFANEVIPGLVIEVRIVNAVKFPFNATYARDASILTYNLGRLGHKWFDTSNAEDIIRLTIHELGHHYESDHLSEGYFRALEKLGARAVRLALTEPDLYDRLEIREGVAA